MARQNFSFVKPGGELAAKWLFEPLPFPVRSEQRDSILQPDASMPLADRLLQEMDEFLHEYPECRRAYAANAGQLAMICASHHALDGDFVSALEAVDMGLRADPRNKALKVHQALALQLNGYSAAAAAIYEQLLWELPHAYDPVVVSLAVKAFVAEGNISLALKALSRLPEPMFLDPALTKLREALLARNNAIAQDSAAPIDQSLSAAGSVYEPSGQNYCTHCGTQIKRTVNFCTACGAALRRS